MVGFKGDIVPFPQARSRCVVSLLVLQDFF